MRMARIQRHEIGLLWRGDALVGVIQPGSARRLWPGGPRLERWDMRQARLAPDRVDMMMLEDARLRLWLEPVDVADHQRGLLFLDGLFEGVLAPGRHVFFKRRRTVEVRTVALSEGVLAAPDLDVLLENEEVRALVEVVDLTGSQRALVFRRGCFERVLGPGRHAVFKLPEPPQIEIHDVRKLRFEHEQLEAVVAQDQQGQWFHDVAVQPHERLVVSLDGEPLEVEKPGRHVFWRGAGHLVTTPVDLRAQSMEIGGQDIMTKDKVTLRVNASVAWKVTDPRKALMLAKEPEQLLYRETQLALRRAVGGGVWTSC
jgi:hypothetical protein